MHQSSEMENRRGFLLNVSTKATMSCEISGVRFDTLGDSSTPSPSLERGASLSTPLFLPREISFFNILPLPVYSPSLTNICLSSSQISSLTTKPSTMDSQLSLTYCLACSYSSGFSSFSLSTSSLNLVCCCFRSSVITHLPTHRSMTLHPLYHRIPRSPLVLCIAPHPSLR